MSCIKDLINSCLRLETLTKHLLRLYLSPRGFDATRPWSQEGWDLPASVFVMWDWLKHVQCWQIILANKEHGSFPGLGWHKMLLIVRVKWQKYQTANLLQRSSTSPSSVCNHESASVIQREHRVCNLEIVMLISLTDLEKAVAGKSWVLCKGI